MTKTRLDRVRDAYSGRSALVTGGFGFKGTWLALMLRTLGAQVTIAGHKNPDRDLSETVDFAELSIDTHELDVRSTEFADLVSKIEPDYVFHLAAQPIVLEGYQNPQETFSSNVMGSVNVLDAVRKLSKEKVSLVNVTTDKVYRDVQKTEGYIESDELRGLDPYSASKSCSELVTFAYRESFFSTGGKSVSTCRAGNVLGGGDYSANRIIPDIVRAVNADEPVGVRNFESIRPYEHVLDALYAYVLLASRQYDDPRLAGEYNIGPNDDCLMRTREVVDYAQRRYGLKIEDKSDPTAPHETEVLTLNSELFRRTFNWAPKYDSKDQILRETFDWYTLVETNDATTTTLNQIRGYLND